MNDLFSLADRAAVVAEAIRGIGLAIAREYGSAGAVVAWSVINLSASVTAVSVEDTNPRTKEHYHGL